MQGWYASDQGLIVHRLYSLIQDAQLHIHRVKLGIQRNRFPHLSQHICTKPSTRPCGSIKRDFFIYDFCSLIYDILNVISSFKGFLLQSLQFWCNIWGRHLSEIREIHEIRMNSVWRMVYERNWMPENSLSNNTQTMGWLAFLIHPSPIKKSPSAHAGVS